MMAVTGSKPAEEALKLKSSSVPRITDVPEIEDAQGLKRVPPTTDQTHGPKWTIFW